MSYMFYGTVNFNQPIGIWDVGNVMYMGGMFGYAVSFNQPIENWDVSNVMYMDEMFYSALNVNHNLSPWCVENISLEPFNFSMESALADANKPVWGTCPE